MQQTRVFLIAVAQEFIEEKIGTKANFQYIVMLRVPQSKAQWVTSAFGPEAFDGFTKTNTGPHNIPNLPNNGSAGIGYVFDAEKGEVLRVRFPYTGAEAIDALREEHFDYERAEHGSQESRRDVPNPEPVLLTKPSGMPVRPRIVSDPSADPFPLRSGRVGGVERCLKYTG